jgi:PilZ domain
MEWIERRSIPRLRLRVTLRLRVIGLLRESADEIAESLNISHRGVCFRTHTRFEVGTPVEVSIRVPSEITGTGSMEERCYGRVVHAQAGPHGDGRICYGVVFEEFISQIPTVMGLVGLPV